MTGDRRAELGSRGEDLALDHLRRQGFSLLARNHRTRHGEIDLIVCDATTTVFVEVKTRRGAARTPFEAIGEAKRRRLRSLASAWLAQTPARPRTHELRFDAIAVVVDARGMLLRLEHLEGAF